MELLLNFDQQAFHFINETLHNPFVFTFFSLITNIADIAILLLGIYFLYIWLFKRNPQKTSRTLKILLPVLATFAITLLLKLIFQRAGPSAFVRPWPEFSVFPWHYAFPSGHTSRAFAFAAVIGQQLPVWRWPLLSAAALIGFSRIYIGAHFPADVIAGALLGVLVVFVFKKLRK